MRERTATRRARITQIALVAASILAGVTVGAAPRVAAQSIEPRLAEATPMSWVDDLGRQYTVTSTVTPWESGQPEYFRDLLVMRANPDGTADTSWGTVFGLAGTRKVALTAPEDGFIREEMAAPDRTGKITITWRSSTCSWIAPSCDRWIQTIDVAGTVLTSVDLGTFDGHPFQPLADGSLVTRRADDTVGWLAPDGTVRATTVATHAALANAALSTDGKLLLESTSGTITRYTPAGALDLTLDAGCTDRQAVGPAPDGAIVALCIDPDTGTTAVTEWDATGTQLTSGPLPLGGYRMWSATRVVLADDALWFGGVGPVPENDDAGMTRVFRFDTITGDPAHLEYERPADLPGQRDTEPDGDGRAGITQLEPISGGRVLMAHHQSCCNTIGGRYPDDRVHASILPLAGTAPQNCELAPFTFAVTPDEQLALWVPPCAPTGVDGTRADGYIIGQTTPAGTTVDHIPMDDVVDGVIVTSNFSMGVLTELSLAAYNETGITPWPESTEIRTVLPWQSTAGFVADLWNSLGVTVDPASQPGDVAGIDDRSVTPEAWVASMEPLGTAGAHVEPVARLYRAFFLRDPDPSGLRYWVGRHQSGVRLAAIAGSFARSSEFTRRYGSLTDRQFVQRVYQNVLGRQPDAKGLDYWTRRLSTTGIGRGGLMAQFSESSEFRAKNAPVIGPLALTFVLLRRLPTATERSTWAASPEPLVAAAQTILRSQEFLFSRLPHPHP